MATNLPNTKSAIDLGYLLDAIDASEELWAELPALTRLFLRESREGIYQRVTREAKGEEKTE